MDIRKAQDAGFATALSAGVLVVFYLVWAAMHDLAHGDPGTLEYSVLIVCVPVFVFLIEMAVRLLTLKAQSLWLGGIGLLLLLLNAGALYGRQHPKYPLDPKLAGLFLMAGVPVLGLIAYHLLHDARQLRALPRG
jgi:hypothetical protein